jgi:histidine ammonia-lyase
MAENLYGILGIEALCAAQGVELRAPLTTSKKLQSAITKLRQAVPALDEDRYMAPDLAAATALIANGKIAESVNDDAIAALAH